MGGQTMQASGQQRFEASQHASQQAAQAAAAAANAAAQAAAAAAQAAVHVAGPGGNLPGARLRGASMPAVTKTADYHPGTDVQLADGRTTTVSTAPGAVSSNTPADKEITAIEKLMQYWARVPSPHKEDCSD